MAPFKTLPRYYGKKILTFSLVAGGTRNFAEIRDIAVLCYTIICNRDLRNFFWTGPGIAPSVTHPYAWYGKLVLLQSVAQGESNSIPRQAGGVKTDPVLSHGPKYDFMKILLQKNKTNCMKISFEVKPFFHESLILTSKIHKSSYKFGPSSK